MVLIAVRQGVGLTGLFALKATLRVLLMIRGQCEATALLATPMRKKHCLRRREVYLPRGVCFSTEL